MSYDMINITPMNLDDILPTEWSTIIIDGPIINFTLDHKRRIKILRMLKGQVRTNPVKHGICSALSDLLWSKRIENKEWMIIRRELCERLPNSGFMFEWPQTGKGKIDRFKFIDDWIEYVEDLKLVNELKKSYGKTNINKGR